MDNNTIAKHLTDHAAALAATGANLYRVRSLRRAAALVKMMPRELSELFAEGGAEALAALPGIGEHIAFTIEDLLRTGHFHTLGREPGTYAPERDLSSLPGVGPRLAHDMRETLGIHTLDEVERAAIEGRLEVLGVGPKRLRGLLDALEGRRRKRA